jgi:hypothetical protein
VSIKCEFWDIPERGGIWKAEIEGGLDGRMAHLTAASFAEIGAQIQAEMQRRLPQPKPVVEPLPEPAVEVLPDDFHLPSEPLDPDLHFVISPSQANDLRADEPDDIARPVEPVDHPVTVVKSKRRGRPPRARDANEDGA